MTLSGLLTESLRRSPRKPRTSSISASSLTGAANSHFSLPTSADELLLESADPLDLLVREHHALEQLLLGDLAGLALDHHDRVGSAGDDHVELAVLEIATGRVDDELPSTRPTRTAPTGPSHGIGEIVRAAEAPMIEKMSGVVLLVGRRTVETTCTSDMYPFGKSGRIGRSVSPSRKDRVLGRTALALDETARDLAGGVHSLFEVDREREKRGILLGLADTDNGHEQHRIAVSDRDGAAGLLGQEAVLYRQGTTGDFQ